MPGVSTARRRLITFAALMGLAAFVASWFPATARVPDYPYQVFMSEQTGYFFFWDPGKWTFVDTSSQPGADWIRLSKGDIIADVSAIVAPGISATACLQQQLDQLASTRSIVAVEALTPEGGPPRIPPESSSSQPTRVSVDLVVSVAEAGRKTKYAVELTCHDIESGQSVAVQSVVVPAQLFNEQSWETLHSPVSLSSENFVGLEENGRSISIPDQQGGVAGAITTATTCPFVGVFVRAWGFGQEDLVIDPAALVARELEDGEVKPASVTWFLPQADPDAAVVVHSGEMALFQIVVDSSGFELSYEPPDGQPVPLGEFYAGCGGGGGGLPVLIDID
jgi:hypothetical protein